MVSQPTVPLFFSSSLSTMCVSVPVMSAETMVYCYSTVCGEAVKRSYLSTLKILIEIS